MKQSLEALSNLSYFVKKSECFFSSFKKLGGPKFNAYLKKYIINIF